MSRYNVFKIHQSDREHFCNKLLETSTPNSDFYLLVFLSTLIVTSGLLIDNLVLLIGGMLVAPLLSPILAIALGIVISDNKLLIRSGKLFFISFIISFCISLLIGIIDSSIAVKDIHLIKIMNPNMFTFFVAVISGLAASFTWVKPNLNETLPGISITVTLLPPLTALGLTFADQEWLLFSNALKVLCLNVFGIIVSSLIVFSLMEFYKIKKIVKKVVTAKEKKSK